MKKRGHRFWRLSWRMLGAMLFLCMLASCRPETAADGTTESSSTDGSTATPVDPCNLPPGSHTVRVAGIAVDVVIPAHGRVGDLLVLPPWDASRADWCTHARLCARASRKGYRLIIPEMGKSFYTQAAYPETRPDWATLPTFPWLRDSLLTHLQQDHCLLLPDGVNYALGASAGARGVLLLADAVPELFTAVAALSGDYDPSMIQADNLYRGFLGTYEDHPERWTQTENVARHLGGIRCAVYLAHGKSDALVPWRQTADLAKALERAQPGLEVKLHLPEDRGNEWGFWSAEVGEVLDFFEATKAQSPESAL